MQHIGEVLYKLRHDKGVRQREVAIGVDMDPATYSRTEKGLREPSIVEMFLISEYYGLLPTTLIEMFQRQPAELEKIKQLEIQVIEALRENKALKDRIDAEITQPS